MVQAGWSGASWRAAVVIVALGLAAGCAEWNEFIEPDVAVADLRLESVTLLETTAILAVRVGNENPEPMIIEGGGYELEAGGWRIGKGLSPTRLELPPYTTAVDRVEIHLSHVKMATRLREIIDSRRLDYRLASRLRVVMPYGKRTVTTSSSGELDLSAPGQR